MDITDKIFNFKLLEFNSIPSTSTYIKEEFKKDSVDECLCVLAKTQSQGRGSSNRSWYSPEGNIYVSFGVKKNQRLSSTFSYLPLRVGKIVHDFLQDKYGINCYIKWPNDIYFGCKKLCGILCESFVQGDISGVIIGIGVNVKKIDLSSIDYSFKVDPTSLEDIICSNLDLSLITKEFIEYFSTHLKYQDLFESDESSYLSSRKDFTTSNLEIPSDLDYSSLFYPSHYPHYDIDSKNLVSDVPFSPDAYKTGVIPLYCKNIPFLGADIGNSRVKLFVISSNNEIIFYDSFDLTQKEDIDSFNSLTKRIEEFLETHYQKIGINSKFFPCHSISVSDKNKELFLKVLPPFFQDIPVIKREVRLRYSYQDLGIDRACLMEGALKIYQTDRFALISSGTATTVDIVDKGVHIGGFILPGNLSYFKSLAVCSNLEDISNKYLEYLSKLNQNKSTSFNYNISDFLGNSTKSCMFNGYSFTLISLLQSIVETYNKDIPVIITGGGSKVINLILNKYNFSHSFKEDSTLTAIGIKTMVKGG